MAYAGRRKGGMGMLEALLRARDLGYVIRPRAGDEVEVRGYLLDVGREAPDELVVRAVAELAAAASDLAPGLPTVAIA